MNTKELQNAKCQKPEPDVSGGSILSARSGSLFHILRCTLAAVCAMPLCIVLTGTALVLQSAFRLRESAVTDDALPPPLPDYIPPAAAGCLTLGWILALLLPLAAVRLFRLR